MKKVHVLWIMRQFTMYLDYKETLWKKKKCVHGCVHGEVCGCILHKAAAEGAG